MKNAIIFTTLSLFTITAAAVEKAEPINTDFKNKSAIKLTIEQNINDALQDMMLTPVSVNPEIVKLTLDKANTMAIASVKSKKAETNTAD